MFLIGSAVVVSLLQDVSQAWRHILLARMEPYRSVQLDCTCETALAQSSFYNDCTDCHALMLLEKTLQTLQVFVMLFCAYWASVVYIRTKLWHSVKELLHAKELI